MPRQKRKVKLPPIPVGTKAVIYHHKLGQTREYWPHPTKGYRSRRASQ